MVIEFAQQVDFTVQIRSISYGRDNQGFFQLLSKLVGPQVSVKKMYILGPIRGEVHLKEVASKPISWFLDYFFAGFRIRDAPAWCWLLPSAFGWHCGCGFGQEDWAGRGKSGALLPTHSYLHAGWLAKLVELPSQAQTGGQQPHDLRGLGPVDLRVWYRVASPVWLIDDFWQPGQRRLNNEPTGRGHQDPHTHTHTHTVPPLTHLNPKTSHLSEH